MGPYYSWFGVKLRLNKILIGKENLRGHYLV